MGKLRKQFFDMSCFKYSSTLNQHGIVLMHVIDMMMPIMNGVEAIG
jgi:hypothetical protein